MSRHKPFLLLGSLLLLASCTSQVTGSLNVDDTPFVVEPGKCRSGAAFNYSGIQLEDTQGRKLRLDAMPNGSCIATLISPAGNQGTTIPGPCGSLTMQAQSSRINNISNIQGNATLLCEGAGHKISGTLVFKNCH